MTSSQQPQAAFEPADLEANYHAAASFDVIREERLRRLADYWLTRRRGRLFPARGDIDPSDIPWALKDIYIADRVDDPAEWRYRLAGHEIESAFRRNSLRGVGLDEILSPERFRLVARRWQPVAEGRRAVYMHGLIYKASDRDIRGARILLPLSEHGDRRVTGLVGLTVQHAGTPAPSPPVEGLDVYNIELEMLAAP